MNVNFSIVRQLAIALACLWPAAAAFAAMPLGNELQINQSAAGAQQAPRIAFNTANAQYVVAWQSYGQVDANDVFARRFDSSGAPAGAEFQVNTFTLSLQGASRIACSPVAGGDRLVMWESLGQEGQPDRGIFAQRLAEDGTPVGAEFQVNDYIAYNQSVPAAAIDDGGSFVIAWGSNTQDGEGMGVFQRRFDSAGSALGQELQVNSFIFDRQRNPRIAMKPSGDFVVLWESYNQEGRRQRWGSFLQQYTSDGTPLGRELLVNSYVRRSQGDPDVAMNPADGSFFVVWNSELQDGGDFGVFGQRFADPQLCPTAPLPGCVASSRATFRMRNDGCDDPLTPCSVKNAKDLVQWKWARPAGPHTVSPFGDDHQPESGDEEPLALCIYDESSGSPALAGSLVVAPSGKCFKSDCWRGSTVQKYRDRDQSPTGVRKLILGQKSVKLFARGPLVEPPVLPLALDSHVTVQLVSSGGDCIETVFDASADVVVRNDLSGFQIHN